MRLLPVLFLLFGAGKCQYHPYNPVNHPSWYLLDHQSCGETLSDRIIGGKRADMGQFPWMARLGYINPAKGQFKVALANDFKCGGTLINHYYVLTAAHCVCPKSMGTNKLALVRLGEYDASTEIDCDEDICMPPVQDFTPKKAFYHERFDPDTMHNDVAVVRLDRKAEYHQYVTPICMPYGSLLYKQNFPKTLTVAGWGIYNMSFNNISDYLYFVKVPLRNMQVCKRSMPIQMIAGAGQICAGGMEGYDSCGGDSGGPLMAPASLDGPPKFFQFGLVSFGTTICGTNIPAIYTDVVYFLKWILDKVTP